MTAGEEESRDRGSSQGRNGSESPTKVSLVDLEIGVGSSLLAKVDLLVPLSPDLGRSEHATRSAHVSESSLSSTVGSSSRNTRNTGNSTTCIGVISHCSLLFASKAKLQFRHAPSFPTR